MKWVAPRTLLTPDRLDVVVKWRFFVGKPDAERLYRWHIEKRTGGVERRSWKTTVEHYVAAADALLQSMRLAGFDAAWPIVVGTNGGLKAGAHRLACGLALGMEVAVTVRDKPRMAAPWGAEWFRRYGLSAGEIARLSDDLVALQHD